MTFKNNPCPVCGRSFTDEDDIVVCPECGTPHHRACWEQYGHCANRARHGNYQWINTAPPEPEEPHGHPDAQAKSFFQRVADNMKEEDGYYDEDRPARPQEWECRSCGRENDPESEFCEYCGAPRPLASKLRMAAESFNAQGEVTTEEVDGIPVRELGQYIGPGAHRYIFRFAVMEKRGAKVSWNWGAALFGPFWCFYRKLYSVGLLYLLASLIVAVICLPAGFSDYMKGAVSLMTQTMDYNALIEYIGANIPTAAPWQTMLSYLFRVGAGVALGLLGNSLYRGKVRRSILQIRTQASDMETYLYLLARKGRVSIVWPVVAAFVYTYLQSFVMMGFAMLLNR